MSGLSPLMSIAGAGLLPNPPPDIGTTFVPPTDLIDSVVDYSAVPVIASVTSVKNQARDLVVQPPVSLTTEITANTYLSLLSLGSDDCPALTDTLPGSVILPPSGIAPGGLVFNGIISIWDNQTDYVTGDVVKHQDNIYEAVANSKNVAPGTDTSRWKFYINSYTMSGSVDVDARAVVDTTDLSKFCQVFMTSLGYLSQANATLNSLKNSDIIAQTFDPNQGGMDVLSTGGLNLVSDDIPVLATDFKNLGEAISLANLNDLGLPGELLAQMSRVSGGLLPGISDLLLATGVSQSGVNGLNRGVNQLTNQEELNAYTAMSAVTGDLLAQVKAILGVATGNLANLAQILDPRHALPNSFMTLLCPDASGLSLVYLPIEGAPGVYGVNLGLEPVLDNALIEAYSGPNNVNSLAILKKIIPQDAAIANKALARSLQQIKNITSTTLPQLARSMSLVQPMTGLDQVNGLSTPIPDSVKDLYRQQLGQGSGPNGTVLLTDVLGVVVDPVFEETFVGSAQVLSEIDTQDLQSIFQDMLAVIAAPSPPIVIASGPAAGEYNTVEGAFTGVDLNPLAGIGLIPAANTEIGIIVVANPSAVETLNSGWDAITESLEIQADNQAKAEIDFGELTANNVSSTMIFTANLHEYAVNVDADEFLTATANTSSLSGQSMLGSLREGKNLAALQDTGIKLDTQLPDTPS
jgi:hypothetical protein